MSKQVRLDEDVYAKIADEKREDETFSDAIDRLTSEWSLAEWAQTYDSDADEIERRLERLDQTEQRETEELLERLGIETG